MPVGCNSGAPRPSALTGRIPGCRRRPHRSSLSLSRSLARSLALALSLSLSLSLCLFLSAATASQALPSRTQPSGSAAAGCKPVAAGCSRCKPVASRLQPVASWLQPLGAGGHLPERATAAAQAHALLPRVSGERATPHGGEREPPRSERLHLRKSSRSPQPLTVQSHAPPPPLVATG